MTKRAVIIITSILVGLMMLFTILFGAVFRVRQIEVVKATNFHYSLDEDDVVLSSKLKKNISIFDVNLSKVKDDLEKEYPYAKVDVNLDSFTRVKITLSNRTPLYYFVENELYYILDEDCKVLEVTNNIALAQDYILLHNVFSVGQTMTAGQFLNGKYTNLCSSIYKALYQYVGEDANNDGILDNQYITKGDIYEVIRNVKFERTNELFGEVDKLVMSTSYGVKITIIEPQKDLGIKTNMAFSALRVLQENDRIQGGNSAQTGSINVIYKYDDNNNASLVCEYRV